MKNLNFLFKVGKISRINEDEKQRYSNFFSNSYKENLEHCKFSLNKFPRWSIISGYYAMHDLAKLLLADRFAIKIDFSVHETTIEVLKGLIKDKTAIDMINLGYAEFVRLLNDLAVARSKRTKAQYYTGAEFLREKYKREAEEFLKRTVLPFINKIKGAKDDY